MTGARSRLMFSTLRACFSVGFALGPAIVAPFLTTGGPRRALWLVSGCWAASAVLALLAADRAPAAAARPRRARATCGGRGCCRWWRASS